MGKYRRLVERLIELQEKFHMSSSGLAEPWLKNRNGTVSLLQVIGLDGETFLLKYEEGRLKFAQGSESPKHVFVCSADTFLDLIDRPTAENLRSKITKGHFYIRDASTGDIDLVEIARWTRAFQELGKVLKHLLGGASEF